MTGASPPGRTPPRERRDRAVGDRRGQANLAALAVAVVVLTAVATAAVAVADGALAGADRDPADRHAAAALADRLLAGDSPTTFRPNALNESAVANLTPTVIDRVAPPVAGRAFAVRLDDETLVSRGDPGGGTAVGRVVLAGTRTTVSETVSLSGRATLPRRTNSLEITVDPASNTTVRTVRVNDRVVLHDPDGLSGTATVDTSRLANATVSFETGANETGSATVAGRSLNASESTLQVVVDG